MLRPLPNLKNSFGVIKCYESLPKTKGLKKLIYQVQEGFSLKLFPKTTLEGTSGVYMLRNAYRKDAVIYSAQFLTIFCLFDKGVFKPIDEEPFAPNNPKGYKGKFGTPGFR